MEKKKKESVCGCGAVGCSRSMVGAEGLALVEVAAQ